MTFDDFLRRRRLDVGAFRTAEPARAAEWEAWYAQMHADSFLLQVKQVLNDVRRRYHLAEAPAPPAARPVAPGLRPDRRARPIGPVTDIPILAAETAPGMPPTKAEMLPAAAETTLTPPEMVPTAAEASPTGAETALTGAGVAPPHRLVTKNSPEMPPTAPAVPSPPAEMAPLPAKPPRPRAVIRRPAPAAPPEQGAEAGPASPPTATETGVWLPATTGSAVPDGPPVPPETVERPGPDIPEATPGRPENDATSSPPPTKPARPRPIIRRPPPPPAD